MTAQETFQQAVHTAQSAHRQALQHSHRSFVAAREQAYLDWQARLEAAKAAFDAVKSIPEPTPEIDAIRRAYDQARSSQPDIEPARRELGRSSTKADAMLTRALVAARAALQAAA